MSLKLVTFDVTGTLLNFGSPVIEKYIEIGSKFGIKVDHQSLKKNFSEAWKALSEEHPNYGRNSGLGWQNWWAGIVERSFTGYIKPEEQHKASEMAKVLLDFYNTKEAFVVQPGTIDFLEYLKTKRLKLGVISNYDPRMHLILDFMGLRKYFDFVLLSYEFGHPKPDARIFQEALNLGGGVSANKALHVGDNLLFDYLGAKESGWRAALISSDDKNLNENQVQKDEVFKDFNELKTHFQNGKMDC